MNAQSHRIEHWCFFRDMAQAIQPTSHEPLAEWNFSGKLCPKPENQNGSGPCHSRATSRIPLTCDHPRWDHDNSRTHTWDLGPPGTSWDPLGLGRNPPGLRPSTRTPPSCCTSGCIHPIPFGHQRRGNPHPSKVGLTGRSHDSRCKVLRCLLQ